MYVYPCNHMCGTVRLENQWGCKRQSGIAYGRQANQCFLLCSNLKASGAASLKADIMVKLERVVFIKVLALLKSAPL